MGAYAGALLQVCAAKQFKQVENLHRHIAICSVSNSGNPAILILWLPWLPWFPWFPWLSSSSSSPVFVIGPPPPYARLHCPCRLPNCHLLLAYNLALLRPAAPYSCLACISLSKIYLTPPSRKVSNLQSAHGLHLLLPFLPFKVF